MNLTGEPENGVLRLDFDRRIMVQFRGSVVTSDAGLLAYRELDDALGLTTSAGDLLADARTGKNGRHALVGMFRQSVFGRLAGYEDVNDALRLRHDPAMRWIIGGKATKRSGASPSQMGRFETHLACESRKTSRRSPISQAIGSTASRNAALAVASCSTWTLALPQRMAIKRAAFGTAISAATATTRSSSSIGTAIWSAARYVAATCIALTGGRRFSNRSIARYKATATSIAFRGDAAFAQPSMYEYLESEGIEYAIRLPANQILQAEIAHMLKRPVGRPAHYVQRFYKSFRYQAASWLRPRRVVAKVEWHHGELFPRVGFIVTNLHLKSTSVVDFYNKRGTCEQWIKEWKGALKGTRLSCRAFAANAVRLQLHALAYNLGNFLRSLAIPETIAQWSLTTLREKLIKIGAKVVSHGRYVAFQMAEVAIPRKLFAAIAERIAALRSRPLATAT